MLTQNHIVGLGALLSFLIFLLWDTILSRAQLKTRPWSLIEEYRRLPLACLGGALLTGSIFWLAWTTYASLNVFIPALAGLPLGLGFLLIFMALINYLADAYEIYAASALAAASCTRNLCAAALPLAVDSMYKRLGIHWATSLLGFVSLLMADIPFTFIAFGSHLRARSQFHRALVEGEHL